MNVVFALKGICPHHMGMPVQKVRDFSPLVHMHATIKGKFFTSYCSILKGIGNIQTKKISYSFQIIAYIHVYNFMAWASNIDFSETNKSEASKIGLWHNYKIIVYYLTQYKKNKAVTRNVQSVSSAIKPIPGPCLDDWMCWIDWCWSEWSRMAGTYV